MTQTRVGHESLIHALPPPLLAPDQRRVLSLAKFVGLQLLVNDWHLCFHKLRGRSQKEWTNARFSWKFRPFVMLSEDKQGWMFSVHSTNFEWKAQYVNFWTVCYSSISEQFVWYSFKNISVLYWLPHLSSHHVIILELVDFSVRIILLDL